MLEPDRLTSRTIPHRMVAKTLGLYVTFCHAVPLLGTAVALLMLPWWKPSPTSIISTLLMWLLALGVGITVGYHRLFSHRAFQTYSPIRVLIAICGSMAGQGPVIAWVALHRCHHQFSDGLGDPHSPWPNGTSWTSKAKALWKSHFGWVLDYDMPNPLFYCPDLIKDKAVSKVNRLFLLWYFSGLLLPGLGIGFVTGHWYSFVEGFLWAGCFRVAMSSQVTWCINSICHYFGSRPFDTDDHSTNIAWLAVPSFGESWHNNHHAFPRSAQFGIRWWQIDLGYTVIRGLKLVGLAWDVQLPISRK
jgi:stearoyl-CoA desaturase (delta-9 desaturase)